MHKGAFIAADISDNNQVRSDQKRLHIYNFEWKYNVLSIDQYMKWY